MENQVKIGLLGAGAVGCYVVSGLYDKFRDSFMLIAEGERANRLKTGGLFINDRRYAPRVVTPKEAKAEGLDYLIVAVKYTALQSSLDDIAAAISDKTVVVSLMNGVDSEEIIGARIGIRHLLYSYIKIASTRKGNSIHFPLPNDKNGIFVGETEATMKASADPSGRAEAFQALFQDTDVFCHVHPDILSGMWDKFAINISRNLPQAILGVGIGAYTDSVYVADLSLKLRREVIALAAAKGITVKEEYYIAPAGAAQRYSTLQDLDAGRETEVEMFAGAAIRMGNSLGVSCPYCEVVYDLIKALEEKNAGKFDYN